MANAEARKEIQPVAGNKRARREYEILEKFEAGLELRGTEVKSLRQKDVSIAESFGRMKGREVFLYGMHIKTYEQGTWTNHEPLRPRKLLLHRREITRIADKIEQKGYSLIPLSLYFKNGLAKAQVAVVRGKKLVDKREDLKKRSAQRDIERAMSARR